MSTKLNAEEMANAMFPPTETLRREVALSVITEVAQPLADERDELREALEAIIKQWHTPNWKLVESTGAIINKAEYVLAKYPKKP